MKHQLLIEDHFYCHEVVTRLTCNGLTEKINAISIEYSRTLLSGHTLFWCGNGGSAADCQHLAAELVGRFKNNRRALKSIALTTDSSVITSISNDLSYADIFSRQLEALGSPNDILVVISTSGNSENIIRVLKTAKQIGVLSVALLGKDGGEAKNWSDHVLIVPSFCTARIQEMHILIGHIMCDLIEKELDLA